MQPIRGRIIKKNPPKAPDLLGSANSVVKLVGDLTNIKNSVVNTIDAKLQEVDAAIVAVETHVSDLKTLHKGDDGKSPDEEALVRRIISQIRQPQDGKSPDPESLIKEMLLRIPPQPDEKEIIRKLTLKIPDRKADLKIIQENIEIDPMSVIEKIMALPEAKRKKLRLSLDNIDGLDQTISAFRNQLSRGYLHGGGGGGGTTVIVAGTGILVTGTGAVATPYVISTYIAPAITLATTPTATVEETGNTITSVVLNATTVKNANPITSVTFFRNASLIHTQASPLANGGLESYTDTTPVTTNAAYTAKVGDGTTVVTSNTQTFSFVSAYYFGVAAPALSIATDGGGLTKLIQANSASTATSNSPVAQVYYFAYPDSYPALTSIKDPNGFEYIQDFTVTTGITVTNSFGQTNTYRKYEYNNLTTQTNFVLRYIE